MTLKIRKLTRDCSTLVYLPNLTQRTCSRSLVKCLLLLQRIRIWFHLPSWVSHRSLHSSSRNSHTCSGIHGFLDTHGICRQVVTYAYVPTCTCAHILKINIIFFQNTSQENPAPEKDGTLCWLFPGMSKCFFPQYSRFLKG